MTPITQFIFVGTGIAIVGVIIVALSSQTPGERMQEVALRYAAIFNKDAKDSCANAIKQRLNKDLGDPSELSSEVQQGQATLTWRPAEENGDTIVCKYEKGRGGVTSLTIGEREMISSK